VERNRRSATTVPADRRDFALRADLINAYPRQDVGERTRIEFP